MKASLFTLVILISLAMSISHGYAANYYISHEKGDDNRTSKEAQNPNTPWQSIDKINSIFNYLKPGDAILFNRGEVFYGTLHIKSSGTTTSPIKIGAYGSGSKPVITSLKTLSGWKSIGNGIYESTKSIDTKSVEVVLINGEIHELGRYPNSDVANEGYLKIESVNGNYLLSSSDLGGSPSWNGGEVVIKKNQWVIDTHEITSHSGGQVKFNASNSAYPVEKDFGFFIQNHIKTLDTFGEWYFNPTTRKINIYFGNQNPSSMKVEVSTLDNLLIKDYRDANITIENLNFKGVNADAIRLEGGKNIKIFDSEINFVGVNGILALSVVDLQIERNNFTNTYNNGMYLRYGNDNAIIKDNEIRKTALIAGRTQNQDAAGIGIFAYGEKVLVQNNIVINSGFNGIQFSGNYSIVKNNYIDTFCQIKGDGGGIYTFGGVKYQGFKGRKIEGNIVVNSIGSRGGIPDKGVNYRPLAEGIFLDDHSNNIEITGNTVGNTENNGLKMSNVNNILVENNTFFNSHTSITLGNNVIGDDTRGVTINNNQLFAKTADQNTYNINTHKDDLEIMAEFDRNYFFRPLGDAFSIYNEYTKNGKSIASIDNLKQWTEKFGKDKNSVSNSVDLATYSIDKKIGSSLYSNSSFDKNTNGISCSNCSQKWDENSKMNGGSIKVTNSGNGALKLNLGKLKKDKTYLLKFKALANKEANIQTYLRYTGTPWEKLSGVTTFQIRKDLDTFEVLVSPFIDAEEVSLLITVSEDDFTYWMDDLEFVEVEASFVDPDEEIIFEFNPTKNSKTIALSGEYVNAKLEKFSGKVTIPAYGSVVLLRVSKDPQVEKVEEEEKNTAEVEAFYYHFGDKGSITYKGNVFEKLSTEYFLTSGSNVSNVINGSDESLFQSERFDNELQFEIPVGNGSYTVVTYHNELYYGQNGRSQKAGQRVFDIVMEGELVKDNLDLFLENSNQETTLSFDKIQVVDGYLNLDLKASVNNASISAIAIIPESKEILKPSISLSIKESTSQLTEGDKLTLISEISNLDDNVEKVEFYCGLKLVGTCVEKPFQAVIEEIPSGENYVWATVTDKMGNVNTSEEVEFTAKEKVVVVEENNSSELVEGQFYHFGFGGNIVYNGQDFINLNRDYLLSSGSNVSVYEEGSKEKLFQSARFNDELLFKIPVENGTYTVVTYHKELYFGENGRDEKAGQRVFDISIEGKVVKDNLDLYLENNNQETELIFNSIEIIDGYLNLDLKASSNNALISAIAIVPESATPQDLGGFTMHLNTSEQSEVLYQENSFVSGAKYISSSSSNTSSNTSASSEKLFQSERYAKQINFDIPVANGTYTIKTYHNELYFGKGGATAREGRRVYDIFLEDEIVADNFDIFKYNNNNQTILTYEGIEVKDGVLNLDLIASVNNASISGISIIEESNNSTLPTGSDHLFFLNTGSDSDASLSGITYLAESKTDKYYNDGTGSYNNTKANVESLFQTERSGKNLVYTIPVPNGTYTVFTMHHEVWFGYGGGTAKAGKRVYDIALQGEVLKNNFDLFVENKNAPTMLAFENIQVTNGQLTLELNASVNNASISGIAIVGSAAKGGEIAANLRTAQDGYSRGYKEMGERGYKEMDVYTETITRDEVRIFPNPAKGRATLELNAEIGLGRVIIHNMNGQLVSHFDLASIKTGDNQFNIPLDNLSQGVYLVSISNEQTVINKQRLIVNP
ncbi:malectin domain-containing carbohydrate-binding protein [Cyclobacterium marinum]|uniref:malectin domain-containing carbohydrate-binding protein n=1 Tax=Cyclobacterium marinum TaxID=104 RepID=UPI001F5563DA|nr:malectin domain-containing carbohydrate-binding protein [Cyclobacterium marinum]